MAGQLLAQDAADDFQILVTFNACKVTSSHERGYVEGYLPAQCLQ